MYNSNKNLPKPTNHILNKSMIPLNKKESTLSLEKLINRQIEIEEKIDSISNKISKLEKKKQILLMLFEKYGNYSYELISLSVNNVSQAQENIVYYTTNGTLNGKVNSMKAKAIQFITRIIEGSKEEINNNSLVLMTSNLIKMILASMNFAVKNQKLVAFNQEIDLNNIKGDSSEGIQNEYSLLIYSLLTFLSRALIREPIKKDFTSLIKKFLYLN